MSQRTLSALLAVSTLACGGAKAHQAAKGAKKARLA